MTRASSSCRRPVTMPTYGQIAPLNWLNRYRSQPRNDAAVRDASATASSGSRARRSSAATRGCSRTRSSTACTSHPANTYIVISNNTATGGTCFGDSGGPTFDNTSSNLVVAVTSWGQSPNCGGNGGAYRLDQPDDQAFLAGFGIHP